MATNVYLETGDNLDETNFALVHDALMCGADFIQDGYELSDGTGLNVDVAAGTAVIAGYVIVSDAAQTGNSLTASDVNYIFLAKDGTLEIELTGTPTDSDSILLGTATTDGSSITALTHARDITTGTNVLIVKDSDETVNNSTTLQADDELLFTVSAREIWEVDMVLRIEQDNASADFKAVIDIPSGGITAMIIGADDDSGTGTAASGVAAEATYNHTSTVTTANLVLGHAVQTTGAAILKAYVWVGATGGSFTLKWAQNTAQAADTKVLAGSVLMARRIFG